MERLERFEQINIRNDMADIVVCGDLEGEIEKSGELSKLEALGFLAGLLVNGTDLSARVAAQGFEPALLATAVEYGMNAIKTGRRLLLN